MFLTSVLLALEGAATAHNLLTLEYRSWSERTRQNGSLATPKRFVYRVGARSDKNKKGISSLSDIKRDERAKRAKGTIYKKSRISEQTNKRTHKSRAKVSM